MANTDRLVYEIHMNDVHEDVFGYREDSKLFDPVNKKVIK